MKINWFVNRIVAPLSYPNWFYKMTVIWWSILPAYFLIFLLDRHQLDRHQFLSYLIIFACGLFDVTYTVTFLILTGVIIHRGKATGQLTKNERSKNEQWHFNRLLEPGDYPRWINILIYASGLIIPADLTVTFVSENNIFYYILSAICGLTSITFFVAFVIETISLSIQRKIK